jgi:5-methylcytosine-specific restriction endonuclease McrA
MSYFNATKTHCKNGHEFTKENTLISEKRGRVCKVCRDIRTKEWINKNPNRRMQILQKSTYKHSEEDRKKRYARSRTLKGKYGELKSSSKKRNFEMSIDFQTYEILVSNKACHYCKGKLSETGHNLDRIDNRLGYLLDNVVTCCTRCNFVKGLLESAGFLYPRTVELLMELLDTSAHQITSKETHDSSIRLTSRSF